MAPGRTLGNDRSCDCPDGVRCENSGEDRSPKNARVDAIEEASSSGTSARSTGLRPPGSHPSHLNGHSALREFSSFRRQELLRSSDLIPDTVCLSTRATGRPRSPCITSRRPGPWRPVSERRSGLHGHAAASTDGHVPQAADRLASTRARRAAAARGIMCAGTASPVPKYISSGVCSKSF